MSTRKKVIFSLVFLILLFAAAELILSTLIKEDSSTIFKNKDLGQWTLTPNTSKIYTSVKVTTNSLGLRSDEISPVKLPGEKRLIIFGDSSIFGDGVEQPDTFSSVLERLLNARGTGIRYRVVNAGVPGHTTYHSIELLKALAKTIKPDMVLVVNMNSDCIISLMKEKEILAVGSGVKTALRISRSYSSIERAIINMRRKYFHKSEPGPRVPEPEYMANLKIFHSLAKKNAAGIIYIAPPNPMDIYSGNELQEFIYSSIDPARLRNEKQKGKTEVSVRYGNLNHYRNLSQYIPAYRKIMKETADKIGAAYLSLGEVFTGYHARHPDEKLFNDEVHPSTIGHRIIAEEIYAFLGKNKLLQ